MNLDTALQQPDKTRLDLEGVTITRADLKTSSKGSTYYSSTIEQNGTKSYISFFGDGPAVLNEPVNISKVEISTYNGKRSFTAGKFSKVSKFSGAVSLTPSKPATSVPSSPKGNDGPIMGMSFKMAAEHIRAAGEEMNSSNLMRWTQFFKNNYEMVCNSKPIPQSHVQETPAEDVPF